MAKPKTHSLPGMERPSIPEITKAAEKYAEKRDGRMALLKEEVDLKNALIKLLHEHKLESYRDDSVDPPVNVELKTTEKVKVTIGDSDGEEED